ncbi:hypothetical protein [Alishewanella longhuensis]
MKQQVNLFSVSLLPLKPVLPLSALLRLVLIILALSAALLVAFHLYGKQQQQQLLVLQQQQQQLQAQAELLQQALIQRTPNQGLVQQRDALQGTLQQQRLLLQFLALRQQSTAQFRKILSHLVTIDQPQIWLSRFVLEPQQSFWQGFTSAPGTVAIWLEQLAQLEQLKGQQFQQIQPTTNGKQQYRAV